MLFKKELPLTPPDEDESDALEDEMQSMGIKEKDYQTFTASGPGLDSKAAIDDSGRISVSFNLKKKLADLPYDYARSVKEYGVDHSRPLQVPKLSIVIFIVGSRGDVQPYLALALHLILTVGHRVRIATHDTFESFVLEQKVALRGKIGTDGRQLVDNLEFYPVGGDPKSLMAYMHRWTDPGLLPGFAPLTNGDISSKRKMMKEMLRNFYRSCFTPCPQTGEAFAVDAIISNPPAFAHIHVAEALGVPLTMSFTMPWSATTTFSHPLVQVKQSNAERRLTNYLSFAMAELLTWQGLGDVINRFRKYKLGLDPISMASGPSVLDRLKMEHIDITGFMFLENTGYQPDQALAAFLESGPQPIYIGFGSIVVEDPDSLTQLLLDAVRMAGVRALISAGWSEMGGVDLPNNIHILGPVPHDWLFAEGRVSAICIHGGAGTTAIGLRNGLPTIVVPFFGDQPFWGAMIAKTGAGPEPIPFKQLNAETLSNAIEYALSPQARHAAGEMGRQIRQENGAEECADAFHRHLPLLNMRCEVNPGSVAMWWSDDLALRLSGLAAQTLIEAKLIKASSLEPHRPKLYATRRPTPDPVSGGAAAVFTTLTDFTEGLALIFIKPVRGILKITTSLPKGLMNTLISLNEGFEELPKLYGYKSKRSTTRVTGTKTGLIAGGKAFAYGWYEGLSSIFVEPYLGAKKEGSIGALKGFGQGLANLTFQPAAGTLGLLAHPLYGIARDARRSVNPEHSDDVLVVPRRALSQESYRASTPQQRDNILATFKDLKKRTKERKAELKQMAKEWLKDVEEELEEPDAMGIVDSVEGCSSPGVETPAVSSSLASTSASPSSSSAPPTYNYAEPKGPSQMEKERKLQQALERIAARRSRSN